MRAPRFNSVAIAIARAGGLAYALSLILALGSGAIGSECGPVRIGVLLPPEEPQSQSIREGILLAQHQHYEGTNREVEIVIRGRTGQWGADGAEAARMVTEENAAGLVAPPDGAASHLVLQISGRTAVPVITLCPDASVGRTGVPWLLRMVPTTEEEAVKLFEGLSDPQPEKKCRFVALIPEQRQGREIGLDLKKATQRTGCDLAQVMECSLGSSNWNNSIGRANNSGADAILVWLPPRDAGAAAAQLRRSGYSGLLGGPSRLQSADFFAAAGAATEGFVVPAVQRDSKAEERWNKFAGDYARRWNHPPDAMAGFAYDAVELLGELVAKDEFGSGTHTLSAGFSWPGVTGDLRFEAGGNRQCDLVLMRGEKGRFVCRDLASKPKVWFLPRRQVWLIPAHGNAVGQIPLRNSPKR